MFFRSAFQQGLKRGIRFQSTSASAKAQNAASGLVARITGYVNCTIYWSKVTGELAKQVYLKEKLTPPTIAEFQTVYQTLYKQALEYATKPFEVLSQLKSLQKNDYLKLASYGVQLSGLFALGEIVGRRQIVGYPTFGSHEEHHH